MPAKATLYNMKGEPVFDFGTAMRNEVHFSPYGNILALCGFGNLRGGVEFWSVKGERKLINKLLAEDTTYFEWAADNEHFLTATTAPRLRVNNGLKIWDYLGEVSFAQGVREDSSDGRSKAGELWEACFRPSAASGAAKEQAPPIRWPKVQSGQSSVSAVDAMCEAGVYVPPHLRGRPKAAAARTTLREEEPSQDVKEAMAKSGGDPCKSKCLRERSALGGKQKPKPQSAKVAKPAAAAVEPEKKAKNLRKVCSLFLSKVKVFSL